MHVTIVEVNSEIIRTGKTPYTKAKIVYQDEGGKAKSYQLVSFANPAVWAVIKDAKAGDTFDVTVGQNDKGYDTWTAAAKSAGPAAEAPASGGTGRSGGAVQQSRTSTYETPEERAIRQRLIVRQSSLSNALEALTTGAKAPPDTGAVLALADQFADWVYAPAELEHPFEEMKDDFPF